MPDRRDPPPTDEGWYALHDFRTVDWDAWRDAPPRVRDRVLREAVAHLEDVAAVTDADEGATALYSVLGHEADLLMVHLRPTSSHLDTLQRRFEGTELAGFTERATSYVSVTEASGYSERARSYFDGDLDPESGLARYIRSRLYPEIPDAEHVCFYPMDKRRDPEQNWYDLPFDERAEHMDAHGDIGRGYGGKVTQMITGSIGLDDWEWGVTLWADDLTDVKDLLYEMRFDPSTSQFAEFGSFYVGRRVHPSDLEALLAGEPVPIDTAGTHPAGEGGGGAHRRTASAGAGASATETGAGPAGARGPDGDATAPGTDGDATAPGTDGDATAHGRDGAATSEASAHGGDTDSHGGAGSGSAATGDHPHGERDGSAGDHPHGGQGESTEGDGDSGSTDEGDDAGSVDDGRDGAGADHPGGGDGSGGGRGRPDVSANIENVDDIDSRLAIFGLAAEAAAGGGTYAVIAYSEADAADLADETEDLASNFDHYDRHVGTKVRAQQGQAAVVSIWTAKAAAETAAGFMGDLPGISETVGGYIDDAGPDTVSGDSESESGDDGPAAAHAPATDADAEAEAADVREALADLDIYAGQPHGEDVYALVLYSTADPERLFAEMDDLRAAFERYDTHVKTAVYEDRDSETAAVVSLWESERGANRAGEHLADLPDIVGRPQDREGFGTMGMFYTVKPEHREDFVEKFGEVGEVLADVDGHRETALLANREDENDMFIASRWDAKEDAMGFFRSEAFAQTVDWGRDVLDDRPRHVFLA